VGHLAADLQRLIAAETQNFLVLNLPPLGLAPRFNRDPLQSAEMNNITKEFNTALTVALDTLEKSEPDVTIYRLDVAGLFNNVVADPAAFGFANVTDPAAPGLEPGDSSYDTRQIVTDPHRYLFWDELHPTTAAHALLAQRALAAVVRVPEPSNGIVVMGLAAIGMLGRNQKRHRRCRSSIAI
jgi:phospholipase/lecithinase/hemolysin